MSNQSRVHGTQRRTASEFLITVNRLHVSLIARRFRDDEDDGLDLTDNPETLESGAAEVIGDTGRQILAMVEG